jgi:glyoxylase-like metal-dependent hydrolase (beta-lactamase superfamily II)
VSAPRGAQAARDALALAADAGIHRLAVPTPFPVGRVNCYLLEDEPLTLIDTGPNSGKGLDELERGLASRGRRIEDLELIVITHQHTDHLGLLAILARRSGADVAALDLLAGYVERFADEAAADEEFTQALMQRHGVPPEVVTALRALAAIIREFGSSARVTRVLRDGDELELRDRRLRALHRPGHSPTDTLLWDAERRILFAGDHLLARISSNPVVSRPLDGDAGARPRALMRYIESLRATRELPAELVLSGHGDPIVDHASVIDERLRLHERRARRMLGILGEQPLTAYEIAIAMWGNAALTQVLLTLSEVLGHMDLLAADGRVRERERGGVVRFQRVGQV